MTATVFCTAVCTTKFLKIMFGFVCLLQTLLDCHASGPRLVTNRFFQTLGLFTLRLMFAATTRPQQNTNSYHI